MEIPLSNALATAVPSYLVRAVDSLKSLGLAPKEPNTAPIAALVRSIADVDEVRAIVIARTISQQEVFDMVVADQISQMTVGERFEQITKGFDSIRLDAKRMVDQLQDGKISLGERMGNIIMKVSRGDIADRFDDIRKTYTQVTADVQVQIEREKVILEAYANFRGALKEAEILAYEVLEQAEKRLADSKAKVDAAAKAIDDAKDASQADRARLEMARDEALRDFQKEDDRYQVAKDLADNLRVGYNTTEVTMARLAQSHTAKERIFKQAVIFFSTNTSVLSALKASFTGMAGLHEATQTVEAMKEGVSKSLETLAEIGGKVQEAAIRTGYGPTIRADAVAKLVDSVVSFQERSYEIIGEMRKLSTENANEIKETVEAGKKRMAELATRGAAIVVNA